MEQQLELCRLIDGKISIKLDGEEVWILPKKADVDLSMLTEAFQAVKEALV